MPTPLLYYVRHGQTDWNVEGRLQGGRDIPLNPHGRIQAAGSGRVLAALARRDGRRFADLDFVASPFMRARETMELMRAAIGLDRTGYRIDPQLREISFGRWEGATLAELRLIDAAAIDAREHDKWGYVPPGGESYAMIAPRMRAWYESLARDTVAVAHGGTARPLLHFIAGVPTAEAVNHDIRQEGVYRVADGRVDFVGPAA